MRRIICTTLCIFLVFASIVQISAKEFENIDAAIEATGKNLYETVTEPYVGTIGGEWVIIGLSRGDIKTTDGYFESYYDSVETYVKNKKGVLHKKKYTEYSRVIIALTALGKDPSNVAGYDLLIPLADYEKTIFQGINGAAWALIALDCGNYDMPSNPDAKVQATRDMYIEYILKKQLSDGGWALTGDVSDPDVTAMMLTALSNYRDDNKINTAIEKALSCLSKMQNATGGFLTGGGETSESCVQVIVALCELGIPINDSRFVKSGNNLLDALLLYYDGKGGFYHEKNGEINQMATEQCFYALVALKRFNEGKSSLFQMDDVKKHKDVKKMPVISFDKTFGDIGGSIYKKEILSLASRGIINGKTDKTFEPESFMTRAEFAAIVTRSLGLPLKSLDVFDDVKNGDWFYSYIGTAQHYGIVKGVSPNLFNPHGTITREEAACMIARAAMLCGHDTSYSENETRNVLSKFSDHKTVSGWAKSSLAFCYSTGILDDSVLKIEPKERVTREQIAFMLYNLLDISKLLQE